MTEDKVTHNYIIQVADTYIPLLHPYVIDVPESKGCSTIISGWGIGTYASVERMCQRKAKRRMAEIADQKKRAEEYHQKRLAEEKAIVEAWEKGTPAIDLVREQSE